MKNLQRDKQKIALVLLSQKAWTFVKISILKNTCMIKWKLFIGVKNAHTLRSMRKPAHWLSKHLESSVLSRDGNVIRHATPVHTIINSIAIQFPWNWIPNDEMYKRWRETNVGTPGGMYLIKFCSHQLATLRGCYFLFFLPCNWLFSRFVIYVGIIFN